MPLDLLIPFSDEDGITLCPKIVQPVAAMDRWPSMIELVCQYQPCGKVFKREQSRVKHGRGKHCSPDCQYAARRAGTHTGIILVCIGCGETFTRMPSQVLGDNGKRGCGKYCNRECRDKNRIGELHPQTISGTSGERRGANWQAQKRKARKRDNFTCQHCFKSGEDVHHIIPFRFFGLARYKEANDLANLVTLCHPCHRRADAEIQRCERQISREAA